MATDELRGDKNISGGEPLGFPPAIRAIAQGALVIIVTLNALGYSWIIVTTARDRQLHAVSNFYLVNLCAAELLLSCVLVPVAFVAILQIDGDVRPVELNAAMASVCGLILSGFFFSASLIMADKHLKLFRPFLYDRVATVRVFGISLLVVWGLAFLIALILYVLLVVAPTDTRDEVTFLTFIGRHSWVPVLLFDGVIGGNVTAITLSNVAVIRLAYRQARRLKPAPKVARSNDVGSAIPRTGFVTQIGQSGATIDADPHGQRRPPKTAMFGRTSFIIYACTFTLAWTPAITLVNVMVLSSAEVSLVAVGICGLLAVNQSAFATLVYTLRGKEYRVLLQRQATRLRRIVARIPSLMRCWKR